MISGDFAEKIADSRLVSDEYFTIIMSSVALTLSSCAGTVVYSHIYYSFNQMFKELPTSIAYSY